MSRVITESVLIAEDDKVLQFTAMRQLQKLGYSAELVDNGSLVLDAVSQKEYALILMDIHMPVLNGLEASSWIRSFEAERDLRSTPIIAMTADPDRAKCVAVGMNDYLMKPVGLGDLERVLKNYAAKTSS